ncbi:hypothetical protein COCON_G00173570 [Conger conger]|uniref:NADH dehydrogenase [ubiquinone] 1 alpha subcomplex assembly factor 3 n=1 Tax=Conger conger TaxID=82655 RepID=A0A9Q1D3R0_CONCO|nr:hypothetical protein COCON_G00173570 [Conger conger]
MAASTCARLFLRGTARSLRLASARSPLLLSLPMTRAHRLGPSDDELYQRTTVSIMQREQSGGVLIYSYSSRGFNIDGNGVIGPCALLPPSILQWNVGNYKDITVESLALFYMVEPRIEVLILGTGSRVERLDRDILKFMRKKGIAVEVQDTPNACATFNFLSSERRIVAAGLIPPPPSTDQEFLAVEST